jgi:hypothetical protein
MEDNRLSVVARASGVPVRIGGESHAGWLPRGAAIPLPTPVRNLIVDIEIQFDGTGYLLCYQSRDGSFVGDTWHHSLEDAKLSAVEQLGVQPSQWIEP